MKTMLLGQSEGMDRGLSMTDRYASLAAQELELAGKAIDRQIKIKHLDKAATYATLSERERKPIVKTPDVPAASER